MICRLIDFTLGVLQILMLKVYGNIGVLKIEFFKFSETAMVNSVEFEC